MKKKACKLKKLSIDKATVRVLTMHDLKDIVGGTETDTGSVRCPRQDDQMD